MRRFWWKLPGPSRFVEQVGRNIRDGKNIILLLPNHSPQRLNEAVKLYLEENGDFLEWEQIDLMKCSGEELSFSPARFLYSRFLPDCPVEQTQNPFTLAREKSFQGKLVWIEGITKTAWPEWKSFIQDYQSACRNIDLLDRSLFCLVLKGNFPSIPLFEDVCLSCMKWEGTVEKLDMLLYVSELFKDILLPPLRKNLAISIVTELAQWDYEVADRLYCEDLESIVEPYEILLKMAIERRWQRPVSSTDKWRYGITNKMDGRFIHHSAWLAASGNRDEIDKRIWAGQLAVLFPYVEIQRQELIKRLSHFLTVPFRPNPIKDDEITDLHDLEINHIHHQIRNNHSIDRKLRHAVFCMKEIRNLLAHLRKISSENLNYIDEIEELGKSEGNNYIKLSV